jgi:NADPH2:quinone reductase
MPKTPPPPDAAASTERWQATAPGAPLLLASAPLPHPGPGEVRLRIAACGLNFADTLLLAGRYQDQPSPPLVPGMEMAGIVEAAGPGVAAPSPGTRVAVHAGAGGLARHAVVPAALCRALPDGLDMARAAAFQVVYGTAYLALARRARLAPGERLAVTGAAGGTGLAAVELGALMGAEVVAVARGAAKLETARAAGARHALDAELPDLRDRLKALGGIDVGVDTVGGALWEALFRAARPEGRLLPLGFAGGEVPQIKANHLLVKNLSVIGFNLGAYRTIAPEALAESLGQVMDWLLAGRLSLRIGARFRFEEAQAALQAMTSRAVAGKIVVIVDDTI